MGFFKIIKKITRVIAAPIDIPFKAVTGGRLIAPITDLGLDITALPVKGAVAIAKSITGPPPVPPPGQFFAVGVPQPVNLPPPGTAPIITGARSPAPGISGGTVAFGRTSPFVSSGGNPAWASSAPSRVSLKTSGGFSAGLPPGWVISGSSVRRSA